MAYKSIMLVVRIEKLKMYVKVKKKKQEWTLKYDLPNFLFNYFLHFCIFDNALL
jgi:hypothetical protein